MESVTLCVIEMHSWILEGLQLLHEDFIALRTCVFCRLMGLEEQGERHFMEKEHEIAGERGEVREKGWGGSLSGKRRWQGDCLFGNENEHPESEDQRFETSSLRGRESMTWQWRIADLFALIESSSCCFQQGLSAQHRWNHVASVSANSLGSCQFVGRKNVRIADFSSEHLAYCTALMSAS